MNTIVTINSFRRGVGKSSIAANLAYLLALQGRRVALLDMDLQTPSAHLFFGLSDEDVGHTLNDYFLGKCGILSAVQDVTARFGAEIPGKLFLVPASTKTTDIMQMLRSQVNIDQYTDGLQTLLGELELDFLLVDTHAGLNEDSLLSMALSKTLVVVLHPDQQDFQGTAVTVDVARNLQISNIHLVLNNTPASLDADEVRAELDRTYRCGDSVVLPHTEELMALASSKLFAHRYPEHPLTASFKELAESL
jgi:septum site-determining protein MinD